jgi:hypothetical protein
VRQFGTGNSNGGSNKCGAIQTESLIAAAARALEAGDPLGASNRVALRDDAPALALRGTAMVQHGRFPERDPLSASFGLGPDSDVVAFQIDVRSAPYKRTSRCTTTEKCRYCCKSLFGVANKNFESR